MSPYLWLALGATTVAVVAGASSSSSGGSGRTIPPPKRVGRRLQSYSPPTLMSTAPGGAPQRETPPDGLTWREYAGKLNIGSIRRPNRDVVPGVDTVDLAEVYSGPGPVRIFVDAYVVDFNPETQTSSASTVANTSLVHSNLPPLDETQRTEQAERIVRDFTTSNDGLVEGAQTSALIEHNERNPPRLPAFYGDACHIGYVTAKDALYHLDDCRGTSRERNGRAEFAYPYEYEVVNGVVRTKLNRTYNLSLEARADGKVYLVAKVMRLPMRQFLSWRAYAAARVG